MKLTNLPVEKNEGEWRAQLSTQEYHVLREGGSEDPGTGEYEKLFPETGYFACRGCGNPAFTRQLLHSGYGWPAFDKCYENAPIIEPGDVKYPEIVCGKCGSHMGNLYLGEDMTETNERHCVNSISLRYVKGSPPEGVKETTVKK